jgi:hypothetical protein
MPDRKTAAQDLAKGAGLFAVHVTAVVVGLVLMLAGLAMGVSLVLLPVGLPVGLVGVLVLGWGLFGRREQAGKPAPPG